jgi:antitoxin MazE
LSDPDAAAESNRRVTPVLIDFLLSPDPRRPPGAGFFVFLIHDTREVDEPTLPLYPHRRYREVPMETRVQKWGNSLAVRIPKSFAEEAGLRANGAVNLSLVDGAIVVQSAAPRPPTLEELLRGVSDDNIPGEWETGPAVGKEVW